MRGGNKTRFVLKQGQLGNPQPSGPRFRSNRSLRIYIVWIRDSVPCGMLLLAVREHSLQVALFCRLDKPAEPQNWNDLHVFLVGSATEASIEICSTVSERSYRVG